MSEEAVAEVLGAHAAASEPSAELWHRVALGQLSPDEAEARLLAERPDASEEERAVIGRAKQMFTPLSDEERQVRLEQLLARRAAEDRAVVVPMRSRRVKPWVVGLLAAAASVVLTVWLAPPRPGPFPGGYDVELDKAVATVRGAEAWAEVPTFLLDGKIVIRLVPENAIEGPIGTVVYAWDRKGHAKPLEIDPHVYDNGVVELDTTVKALGLDEGQHELVIAIGWAEALPSSWDEVAASEAAGPEGFEVIRTRVKVVAHLSNGGGGE